MSKSKKYLFEGSEWNFETIEKVYDACEEIALNELGLNVFQNQIEIITSEQMLDVYTSVGMPVFYPHWSFGKQFIGEERHYRKGRRGLAYELVINSNPCISYLMEENSMVLQATVIAHACFGHNHFFKNNYLFKEWTDPDSIVDYLIFAKNYIHECEQKYGAGEVEKILDSCHSIMHQGVNRSKKPKKLSMEKEKERQKERERYLQEQVNDLWRTLPDNKSRGKKKKSKRFPEHPEENLLYFIEKNSPLLEPWQREIVRIVRKIAQYFYPQSQTKMMNEGFASFVHLYTMNRLSDKRLLSDGSMFEFFSTHTNVIYQSEFGKKGYSGLNPYALGLAMFNDIKRICEDPTLEDKIWFPDFAGSNSWEDVIIDAVSNYRDESFISQFLSPKVIRDFRMFVLHDEDWELYEVSAIHNDIGYKKIRKALSDQYNINYNVPDIQIIDANMKGDRTLLLRHFAVNDKLLDDDKDIVLSHIKRLWGYGVCLVSVDALGDTLDRASVYTVDSIK